MSAVISGTNGLLQSYDYQVLTTGFSYTFAAGTQVLVINPAGTLATGTITMPAAPVDGMTITVESTQQVTALTMSGNGGTVVGPAVQLIPNQPLSWVYRLANTTWYPLWGGAGRASALVSGTSVASTSGTSIDFTSIPSWVKRITVMFSGVSTSGTSNPLIQIGDSGGIENTSYVAQSVVMLNAGASVGAAYTTGFGAVSGSASNSVTGIFQICLVTGNTWVFGGWHTQGAATATTGSSSGNKTLSDTLTQVRITTVNGTDTFDAGTINILYE
jgi:hypothetical protein